MGVKFFSICYLLPQALAQLLSARIKGGLQSSLSPQPLIVIHQFSTAQNLCGMDGGLLVVFGSKEHCVFYSSFTVSKVTNADLCPFPVKS